MNKLTDIFRRNKLLKIASLNTISVGLRLVFGFFTSKLIAIFIGPEGFALLGNFRNFIMPVQSLSTLGMSTAIVKYVSEFKTKVFKLSKIISSVVYLVSVTTLSLSLACFFFSDDLSELLFNGSNKFAYVFKILALALPFFSFQTVIIAIYNGMSKFKTVLMIGIIGQVMVGVFGIFMIWQYGLFGALIAVAIGEGLLALVTLFWVIKDRGFIKLISFKKVNKISLGNLGAYSFMALFSAIITPLVMIAVRNYIIDKEGIIAAGYWDAMMRISYFYLMFTSSLMALYLLPKYAEISSKKDFRNTLFDFYRTVLPVMLIGLIVIYILRIYIIKIVLTEEFFEVKYLFKWQLIGDFIKVVATAVAYQMIAKKMFWIYIITEAFSMLSFYILSVLFINDYGVAGVTLAHAANYVIYLIIVLVIFSKTLGFSSKSEVK